MPPSSDTVRQESLAQRLEAWAARLELRPVVLFALLSVFYLVLVAIEIRRGLWFDELFTFYISSAPTIQKMIAANLDLDLNPPLSYFIVRASQWVFGQNELASRLPTVVGFWVGSAAMFWWLGRRTGNLVAAGAVAALWGGFFFIYATEARPYGLLFGFFGCALYCWEQAGLAQAGSAGRPWGYVAGLLGSTTAMMLTHVLAPFSILPLCLAEMVKAVRGKKVNWPVWVALVLPIGLEVLYVRWMQHFQTFLFPPIYQASLMRITRFYARLASDGWLAATVGVGAGALAVVWGRLWSTRARWVYRFSWADGALGLGMLAMPYLIVVPLMRTHGAFHWRYALVGSLAIWAAFSVLVNYVFRNSKLAAVAFVVAILGTSVVERGYRHIVRDQIAPRAHAELSELRPDLPFVAASGLTFLELDHYESPELAGRLYYLTDLAAATKYAHATLWEGYRGMLPYFPIRGRIAYYEEFLRAHKDFVVLGTDGYLEDWLLARLRDDKRVAVKLVARIKLPYKDGEVYEVNRAGGDESDKKKPLQGQGARAF